MPRILVLAKTGFGKTTSLFAVESLGFIGLDPKTTFIISCTTKPLSVKGAFNLYKSVDYSTLKQDGKFIITPSDKNKKAQLFAEMVKILRTGNRLIAKNALDVAYTLEILGTSKQYKNIVLDDMNYLAQDEYMRNALKGGWDTPKLIGYNTGLIFDAIDSIPETKNIICMAHFEEYKDKVGDSISYKYKSVGNMVDNYITPEGKFEIVLYGKSYYSEELKKSVRVFVTNDDGVYPAKSPVDMFSDIYIPNDMGAVIKQVENYYLGQ